MYLFYLWHLLIQRDYLHRLCSISNNIIREPFGVITILQTIQRYIQLYLLSMMIILNRDTICRQLINREYLCLIIYLKLFMCVILQYPVSINLYWECWCCLLYHPDIYRLHPVKLHVICVVLVLLFQKCELSVKDMLTKFDDCLMDVVDI